MKVAVKRGERGGQVLVDGVLCCGDAGCKSCELPAAFVDVPDGKKYAWHGRYFVRGTMAACGRVMQPTSQSTHKTLINLRDTHTEEEIAELFTRIWF